ncbi:MAG: hypothetical protein JNK23_11985 [Opitutaceae bacterium]|nr:hypothetical protein [Opitutaceae bacterium]
MIPALRLYFLTRRAREKYLLLAFLLIGVLWWLSAFGTRAGAFWREQRSTGTTLAEQKLWLDQRETVQKSVQASAAQLEPGKTLDRAQLLDAVNQAAHEAGLRNNYGSSAATSEKSGDFTVHSVDYQVNGADFVMLQQFYLNLQKRAPYIGIERFGLSATRGNESKLTLQLRVTAVELPR